MAQNDVGEASGDGGAKRRAGRAGKVNGNQHLGNGGGSPNEAGAAKPNRGDDDANVAQQDRQAQAVDTEQPPRLDFPVVGIGASAGGLEAYTEFLEAMPPDAHMAYVLIQHLPPDRESLLVELLSKRTRMKVRHVENGMPVEPDNVYIIRPGSTLTVREGSLHLGESLAKPGHGRPVDDFFRSLAEEQRERAVAIVLSGMGTNGTAGAQVIKAVGGMCIAQDPKSAKFASMPRSLIDNGLADLILRPGEMPDALVRYARHPYASGRIRNKPAAPDEAQQVNEILSILRARTRHDFAQYKRPTLLRRIQRRMGLSQNTQLADYTKLLRQRPGEVTALADDMMIHVTGFFRDPEVWESLCRITIQRLVAERDDGATIRAWASACSTGEEAYTLSMLLMEAAESANKHFDIKIFATDTAQRTLALARAGVYPGGIESEISPERLERFFDKDDSAYRVKRELRESVIFAPHSLLQDPPFSHLDIVTCRNLLIYLEPQVQQYLLGVLHFGLREGGTLLLGSSETVGDAAELFETIDKKHRIFRRVGPTRHGLLEFPRPTVALGKLAAGMSAEWERAGRGALRRSPGQAAQKMLVEHHTPPAVVVDRQHRIHYFHGDTQPFLVQPTGEPTRDVMQMAIEAIRGAIRVALQQVVVSQGPVKVRDGLIVLPEGRRRVVISVAPIEGKESGLYLMTFSTEEIAAPPVAGAEQGAPGNEATDDELHRIRDELQSVIEELQASNEELKASNEEITSINEEMQSTNEELETSKEELQSLNEELTTVNAQLQAKMVELESATNDLSSLLSSTDIAVIFLDTHFRIRRFTPAVRDLVEMLPSDIGRPLADLAQKFADTHLLTDSVQVLDKLAPVEREVSSESGRSYLRRVLPYRTVDNRIDGVVITFVDITSRLAVEQMLRERDEQLGMAQRAARIGFWSQNISNGELIISDQWRDLIGLASDECGDMASLQIRVHPDDRPALDSAYQSVFEGKAEMEVEFRIHHPRNGLRWLLIRSRRGESRRDNSERLTGFIVDITDRKQHETALEAAKAAAESANEAKDHFLASLSHELRTPMTAIMLWAKLLRDLPHSETQLREGIAVILRSAEAQNRLIEDLLDVARMSSGKLRLSPRPCRLHELVQAAVKAASVEAAQKKLELILDLQADLPLCNLDPDRIQQVIGNLLHNALKFTPTGGHISVSLARVDGVAIIRISDDGIGIPADVLERIFDRFRQVDSESTAAQTGLGLGLAISRQIVDLHGGKLCAASDGAGKGAVFTLSLPCSD